MPLYCSKFSQLPNNMILAVIRLNRCFCWTSMIFTENASHEIHIYTKRNDVQTIWILKLFNFWKFNFRYSPNPVRVRNKQCFSHFPCDMI